MLNNSEINKWKNQGYVFKSNLINKNLINECVEFLKSDDCQLLYSNNFGSINYALEFPSNYIIDWISVNENIINCVKQLLNTDDILLAQSDAWRKVNNGNENSDQRMHMDYGNNTFLHPSDWHNPEAVSIIVYFSDISETKGGTAVVPREGDDDILYKPPYINMPGYGEYDFYNPKNQAEEYMNKFIGIGEFRKKLYEREIIASPNVGDILFYRLDTWHRGTPVDIGKTRYVMNLIFKKKECYWVNCWNQGFTRNMFFGYIEKFVTKMSPEQRAVIGIPKPSDSYWTEDKLHYLLARYPSIDINPYLKKLK